MDSKPDAAGTDQDETADSAEGASAADTEAEAAQPVADEAPQWLGRVLDNRYRVLRQLGRGGMGAVYVAEHLTLHKEVAIKVVRAELAGDGDVAIRLAREAMATAQFEHPHVASAIDYGGLPEGGAYFVMQLVRGRSLRHMMHERGPMPWRQACHLGAQIADALSAARAAGIVHRDLKPENVLVEEREDGSHLVKILDFGIAQLSLQQGAVVRGGVTEEAVPNKALTRVGTVIGTPGYMSPEQSVGDKVDHRTDLYALGVILWECIAGQELWGGDDIIEIITRQIKEDPAPLHEMGQTPAVPPDLDLVVQQLLSRDVEARPERPGDVRDMLRGLAASSEAWAATQAAPSLSLRESTPGQKRAPWDRFLAQPRTHRWLQVGLIALAGVLGTLAFGNADPEAAAMEAAVEATAGAAVGGESQARPAASSGQQRGDGPSGGADGSLMHRVVEAASEAAKLPGKAVRALTEPEVPKALAADVKQMLEGRRSRNRRPAARRLTAHAAFDQLPEYLQALAQLEAARSCKLRRAALGRLEALGDARARPSVARYHGAPRRGCGFLNLSDCYGCIRPDLARTIRALGPDTSQ